MKYTTEIVSNGLEGSWMMRVYDEDGICVQFITGMTREWYEELAEQIATGDYVPPEIRPRRTGLHQS